MLFRSRRAAPGSRQQRHGDRYPRYLSYRLPTLSRDDTAILTWRDLMAQFGTGGAGEFASKFKDTFRQSIRRAIEAYRKRVLKLHLKACNAIFRSRRFADGHSSHYLVTEKLPRPQGKGGSQRQLRSIMGLRRARKDSKPQFAAESCAHHTDGLTPPWSWTRYGVSPSLTNRRDMIPKTKPRLPGRGFGKLATGSAVWNEP